MKLQQQYLVSPWRQNAASTTNRYQQRQHNKHKNKTTATATKNCNKNGTHRLIFKRPILFLWPNNKIPDARQKSGVVWVVVVVVSYNTILHGVPKHYTLYIIQYSIVYTIFICLGRYTARAWPRFPSLFLLFLSSRTT